MWQVLKCLIPRLIWRLGTNKTSLDGMMVGVWVHGQLSDWHKVCKLLQEIHGMMVGVWVHGQLSDWHKVCKL